MVPTETPFNYKRAITHTQYKHGDKKIKKTSLSRILPKRITDNKHVVKKHHVDNPEEFPFANERFLTLPVNPHVATFMVGGLFFFYFY